MMKYSTPSQEVDAIYDKELSRYNNHPLPIIRLRKAGYSKREGRLEKKSVENKFNGKIEEINELYIKIKRKFG